MKILIILSIASSTFFLQQQESVVTEIESLELTLVQNKKSDAFNILDTKCNVCHRTKNPWKIFTPENMNSFAPKIHKQVFVKKRMPKGKNNNLSKEELLILKNWLDETLNNSIESKFK